MRISQCATVTQPNKICILIMCVSITIVILTEVSFVRNPDMIEYLNQFRLVPSFYNQGDRTGGAQVL